MTPDPGAKPVVRVRIRLFAVQREMAGTRELSVELPGDATVEEAWSALVGLYPALAPGRASVRFAVNGDWAGPDSPLADGDEVAVIPPVSGGADGADGSDRAGGADRADGSDRAGRASGADRAGGADRADGSDRAGRASGADRAGGADRAEPRRILELRADAFTDTILSDLAGRLATPDDGAVVGFLGITRATPGTPAPGQEPEATRHAGRSVEALDYEALEPMALRILGEIADEVRDRFGVERLAIVHRTGEVPLGVASVAIVACSPHRAAAFAAAAYAIDETKARAPIWKAERFEGGHVWIGAPAREGPLEG